MKATGWGAGFILGLTFWALVLLPVGLMNPLSIPERPLAQGQATLADLRAGKIVGRVVLTA